CAHRVICDAVSQRGVIEKPYIAIDSFGRFALGWPAIHQAGDDKGPRVLVGTGEHELPVESKAVSNPAIPGAKRIFSQVYQYGPVVGKCFPDPAEVAFGVVACSGVKI